MKLIHKFALGAMTAMAFAATPVLAEIRLGATVSETGPAAFLGDPEAKTLKLLVEKINAAGGLNGEKIELFLYDDGGDPNKARTFATRLVEDDEVQAIIGGTTTGTTMSIIPVAEEAKIPFISLAGAIEIVKPVKEWVFKTPHTDRMACEKIFTDMKKQGYTKIGLISGGFTYFTNRLKQELGLDYAIANTLEVVNGRLTGMVKGDIIDAQAKADWLLKLRGELGLRPDQVFATGDGANDLKMLAAAGVGIAYHAKPVVRHQAHVALSYSGLDGVINLFAD